MIEALSGLAEVVATGDGTDEKDAPVADVVGDSTSRSLKEGTRVSC